MNEIVKELDIRDAREGVEKRLPKQVKRKEGKRNEGSERNERLKERFQSGKREREREREKRRE